MSSSKSRDIPINVQGHLGTAGNGPTHVGGLVGSGSPYGPGHLGTSGGGL